MLWLTGRGVSDEDVAATVDRLVEIGELDDARFARRYAEDKRELAGWGAERIRESLIARGVEPEHIEAAMAADEEPDQVVRAAALLARRASAVDSDRARARALGYLTRKGYTYEVAHEAIRAYERG
jgi:regulatory protein